MSVSPRLPATGTHPRASAVGRRASSRIGEGSRFISAWELRTSLGIEGLVDELDHAGNGTNGAGSAVVYRLIVYLVMYLAAGLALRKLGRGT